MKKVSYSKGMRLCALLCTVGLLSGCGAFTSPTYYPELEGQDLDTFTTTEKATKQSAEDLGLERMELAAQDGLSELYVNPKTTEIAVRRKASGQVWFSNPQDRLEGTDPLLHAQFLITTLDKRDVPKLWNNYSDSVAYGQFTLAKAEAGFTVQYLIGKKPEIVLIPSGLTEARYEELLTQLASDADVAYIKRMYGRVDLSTITSVQQVENLNNAYSKLKDLGGIMYTCKNLSKLESKKLTTALTAGNYTPELRAEDEEAVGYTGGTPVGDSFTFAVSYRLENGELVVEADPTQIQSTPKLKISEITFLRNFGAQKPGEHGHVLVPDGSGAIIDADAPKATIWSEYKRSVYGQDYGVLRTDRVDYSEKVSLPVFGGYNPNGGFIGIAENDAAQMAIQAGLADSPVNYSYVCPTFTLLTYALVALESSPANALNLYPRKAVTDPIALRYLFYDAPDAGYSDLAVLYREYLLRMGALDGVNDRKGLAVYANAVGAIDEIESILGYPATVVKPLTTFNQVRDLGKQLKENAPTGDVVIGYSGWQRGGLQSGYIRKPETEPKLGNNQALSQLAADLRETGVALLPVAEQQYCYQAKWDQGFNAMSHAIRFITRDTGYKPSHSIANYYMDAEGPRAYILRPDLVANNAAAFAQSYASLEIGGLGIGTLSSELYSDFSAKKTLSMNDTAELLSQAAAAYKEKGLLLSGYGANAYMLRHLDYAVGLPVTASNHPILTASVPFLQIVLSGSVSYTMPELNQATDPATYLLKAIETGSGIYFDYFAAPGSAIKDTHYDPLYGASEASILSLGTALAGSASAVLAPVANQPITAHRQLAPGVFETTFAGGGRVTVNYNAQTTAGIPAMGYRLTPP